MEPHDLTALAQELAQLDQDLLSLINQRARVAYALERGDPERPRGAFAALSPAEVRSAIAARNRGPLSDAQLATVFTEIHSACLNYHPPRKVAYLGPEASHAHLAAIAHFGRGVDALPQPTVADVFRQVERGQAVFGVAPMDNSLEGAVGATCELLFSTDLKIMGEVLLPVGYGLLGRAGGLEGVRRVAGRAEVLGLCRAWLARHLPEARLERTSTTAGACALAEESGETACLANPLAAGLKGLSVLADDVQDPSRNQTRYLILGTAQLPPSGEDKTSEIFVTSHQPGALVEALEALSARGVNLSRIESRPMRDKPWEYYFLADMDGHAEDQPVEGALANLRAKVSYLKMLGSYPKA